MVLEYEVVEQGDEIDIVFRDPEFRDSWNYYSVTFTYVGGNIRNSSSYRHDGAAYFYRDTKGVVRARREAEMTKVAAVLNRQGTTTVELLKKYLALQTPKINAA